MIGKTLAHYEITSQIGKGGMGEVYKAKDQKLGRDVAIKVLPEEFAKDADRVARFQREAKLLASLNHPNIAAIHGLEEANGTHFLVLELIEGDTLADRIKSGPIPVEESLKLALQIAEALEAAHEKGVIHRDLKPANIKVTPDGKVKVLDFGLAKAFAGEQSDLNLSNSPTLSVAATQQGIILGTAAYMSPEQARGENVDKGADIWAFGAVLFEMLTGRQVFAGKTVSDILASVLAREPEWKGLPPNLHPRIRLLLERCLNKEPKNRYSGVSDARVDIQQVLADPSGIYAQTITTTKPRKKLRLAISWVAAAVILTAIIAGIAVWYLKPIPPPEPKRVVRFEYELPKGQQFLRNAASAARFQFAVSPDGSKFVYCTTEGLCLRYLDSLGARLIPGTNNDSVQPFFSPDGQWVGYYSRSENKLKKVAISGGAPVVLCDIATRIIGASWDSKNTIVYSDLFSGIMRVSANGGTSENIIKGSIANAEKEGFPIAPQMLPDGETLLFTNSFDPSDTSKMQIVIQSLKSGERNVLVKGGSRGQYLPTGHIVYVLSNNNINNLFAIPFDLNKLKTMGGPVSVLEGVQNGAVSDSGTLVYVAHPSITTGSESGVETGLTLIWVDKGGKEEPLGTDPGDYSDFKISPDGTQVALTRNKDGNVDIWVWNFLRHNMRRLTFDEAVDNNPLWTPDGQRILFQSGREGYSGVYWKKADGTGEAEKLASATDRMLIPWSWSGDGNSLVLWELSSTPFSNDIGILPMEGDHARKPLLDEKFNEADPQVSPNGRWMAYQSDESGEWQIYVRSFPEMDKGRWQVSTEGGMGPRWSPDGKELYYRHSAAAMAVDVETEPTFKYENPRVLFEGDYVYFSVGSPIERAPWDIHPNGKKFLMIKPPASAKSTTEGQATPAPQPKIIVVLNWFEELKKRVPVE